MKKSIRPKARPTRNMVMPGDEIPSNRVMTEGSSLAPKKSIRPQARPSALAPKTSPRPMGRGDIEAAGAVERGAAASERDAVDMRRYAKGGEVRGCKAGQMSGKGFRGSY